MLEPVTLALKGLLDKKLCDIETQFDSDFISMYGPLSEGLEKIILHMVEDLACDNNKKDKLLIMVTTTGGSVLVVERIVNIFRQHYDEVNFIIPDYAYSAGTILCMSGDNIYMDYFSALGPIDPQVRNREGTFVPALGYLDKINDLLAMAKKGTLSEAEFLILRDFDLAEVREYEQAKELTIDLLKKWLVKYKFKNWNNHSDGNSVTEEEKIKRASEIAEALNNYSQWKSHGRPINMETLRQLRLRIEDYGEDKNVSELIRTYHAMMTDFANKNGFNAYFHSRRFQ